MAQASYMMSIYPRIAVVPNSKSNGEDMGFATLDMSINEDGDLEEYFNDMCDKMDIEKAFESVEKQINAKLPDEVKEVLNHLDTDKSGKVDFNEFMVLIKDVLKAMLE